MQNVTGKFPEQNAPEKNTDNAFVQVGNEGKSLIQPYSIEESGSTSTESASKEKQLDDNPKE